jgi:hypothetical protein
MAMPFAVGHFTVNLEGFFASWYLWAADANGLSGYVWFAL